MQGLRVGEENMMISHLQFAVDTLMFFPDKEATSEKL